MQNKGKKNSRNADIPLCFQKLRSNVKTNKTLSPITKKKVIAKNIDSDQLLPADFRRNVLLLLTKWCSYKG